MRTVSALACGLVVLVSVLALAGGAAEKWGPFRGQFIDVESGQPIAGAVVLVAWFEAKVQFVQDSRSFYDAREAVTDRDGRFEIPRLTPTVPKPRILGPHVSYFAPGYVRVTDRIAPPDGQMFIAPTVIEMRPVKNPDEQRRVLGRAIPDVPWELRFEKMPRYLEALNEARRRIGLEAYPAAQ